MQVLKKTAIVAVAAISTSYLVSVDANGAAMMCGIGLFTIGWFLGRKA
jgi:hypothetical protein